MDREIVHLSQAEIIRNIAAVLQRVEQGAEVVIEKDEHAVAVIRPVLRGRLLSECIALAHEHASTATLDEHFGKDLGEIISGRPEPLDSFRWD